MKLPNFPIIRRKAYQDKWDKTHWKIILAYLANLKSEKEFQKFFASFVPKGDRLKLIQRVVAHKRLLQGYKHREISAELGISVQTVSSVKSAIDKGGYRSHNERFPGGATKRREKQLRYLDKKADKPVKPRYKQTKYGKVRF